MQIIKNNRISFFLIDGFEHIGQLLRATAPRQDIVERSRKLDAKAAAASAIENPSPPHVMLIICTDSFQNHPTEQIPTACFSEAI